MTAQDELSCQCRELDLTDCTGITDAALLELSKYQRDPLPERRSATYGQQPHDSPQSCDSDNDEEEGEKERTVDSHAKALQEHPSKGGSDLEEDLQFEMEGGPTSTCCSDAKQAQSTDVSGLRLTAGGWSAGFSDEDSAEDEASRQTRLESLALLASSPLMSSMASRSPQAPSSLLVPDKALGSHIFNFKFRELPQRSFESRLGSSVGGEEAQGDIGGHAGWVGSWDRKGAGSSHSLGNGNQTPPSGGASTHHHLPHRVPRLSSAAGPGLRSLLLAGCSQISSEGVKNFMATSGIKGSLEALDLSRCQRINRQALQIPPVVRMEMILCMICLNDLMYDMPK
jgi:hypothetical protein